MSEYTIWIIAALVAAVDFSILRWIYINHPDTRSADERLDEQY